MFLFIGTPEIVMVVLAALLLFGADKMPDFFKTFYKGMSEVRKAANEIKQEFENSANEIKQSVEDTHGEIVEEINSIESQVRDKDD